MIKVIYLLSLTLVFANGFPKFGDKIKKSDKNNSLIEVVMSPTEPKWISDSALIQNDNQNDRSNNDNNNKGYASGQTFQYKYSTSNHENNDHIFAENNPKLQHRTGLEDNNHQSHHLPDFHSFNFGYPQASESGHYQHSVFEGPPTPPPPPSPPQQPKQFQFEPTHYDNDEVGQNTHFLQPQQNRQNMVKIDPVFSFDVPQGLLHPKNDPRANFKKELMGSENSNGKPWGEKMSYTYRDPKNPNNYMQMSEVRMSVNKQMDPQEAASQVQKFLAAAQNGNYGPFSSQNNNFNRNHNNYESDSHYDSHDPPEPKEPKFPDF